MFDIKEGGQVTKSIRIKYIVYKNNKKLLLFLVAYNVNIASDCPHTYFSRVLFCSVYQYFLQNL